MSLRIPVTLRSLGRGFHTVPEDEIEREPAPAPSTIDYTPLVDASRKVGIWLLDVARSRTTDPVDLTAIDRVQRAFVASLGASLGGAARRRPEVGEEDLLTVAGLLLTAFEADLGAPGLASVAGRLYAAAEREAQPLAAAVAAQIADALATTAARQPRAARVVVVARPRRNVPRVVDQEALEDAIDDLLNP